MYVYFLSLNFHIRCKQHCLYESLNTHSVDIQHILLIIARCVLSTSSDFSDYIALDLHFRTLHQFTLCLLVFTEVRLNKLNN